MPHQRHVAKVAQLATATWRNQAISHQKRGNGLF